MSIAASSTLVLFVLGVIVLWAVAGVNWRQSAAMEPGAAPRLLTAWEAIPQLHDLYKPAKGAAKEKGLGTAWRPAGAEPLVVTMLIPVTDTTFCRLRDALIALSDATRVDGAVRVSTLVYDMGLSSANRLVLDTLYKELFASTEVFEKLDVPALWKSDAAATDGAWWWPVGVLAEAFSLDPLHPHRHVAGSDVAVYLDPRFPLPHDAETLGKFLVHLAEQGRKTGFYASVSRAGMSVASAAPSSFIASVGKLAINDDVKTAPNPTRLKAAGLCDTHLVTVSVSDAAAHKTLLKTWLACASSPLCMAPDAPTAPTKDKLVDADVVLGYVMTRAGRTCGARDPIANTPTSLWEIAYVETHEAEFEREQCSSRVHTFELKHADGNVQ